MLTTEERLAGICSTVSEGLIVQDSDGRIEFCNESAQRILALTADQIAGVAPLDPQWQAIHEDGAPFPIEMHPAAIALRTGQPSNGVVMGIHKPGGVLAWISVNARAILRDGKPLAVVCAVADVTERKAAQHAQSFGEERWKLALEGARDGIWDWDAQSDEVFFSRRWKEILGFEESEIGNTKSEWEERIHPEDRPDTMAVLTGHLDGKTPYYEAEYRLKCKDGAWKWVRGRGTVVSRGEDGRPLRFVGAQSDLTAQKRAEEAQRDAERRFRVLAENSRIGVYSICDGRMAYVNPALAEGIGYSIGELIGANPLVFVDPRDHALVAENLRRRLAGKAQSASYEFRALCRNGAIKHIEVYGALVEVGGRPTVIGNMVDVTERRQAEMDLRESEERFRALFHNGPDALYLSVAGTGKILDVNSVFETLFGYSKQELVGRSVLDLKLFWDPADRERVLAELKVAGRVSNFEAKGRKKNGEVLVGSLSVVSVTVKGETLLVGAVRDITAAILAADRLRESEERFAAFMANLPAAAFVKDEEGRTLFANRYLEELSGVHNGEGEVARNLAASVIGQRMGEDDRKALACAPLRSQQTVVAPQGTSRTFEIIKFPIRVSPTETLLGGIALDISELKRAEEELRASKKRFEDVTFSMGDWVWEVDENGVYTYSSQKGFEMFGRAREDVIGKTPFDFMLPDEAERIARIFSGIVARKAPIKDLENWNIGKNGERICLLTSGVPILDEAGNLVGYRGVDKDITARKRVEEERTRLAAAIEQAVETVVITDLNGDIVYANPAFERTTGYTVASALGRNPRIVKSGKHDGEFYRRMWDTLTRGETWRGRLQNKRKDGSIYEEEASISPVRDQTGRVINYIALKLDVTREAELQAQLLQAQKMESIGRLAGGVAHDFNNLLTVINGYSSLTLSRMPAGDPLRPKIEEIAKAGQRAAELTRQLLAFSRQQVLQPRVLDLNRVVRGMHSMLQRLVGEDVETRLSLNVENPTVRADPNQLEQVIMNLAVNAKDAMPRGGRLLIETGLLERDGDPAASLRRPHPGRWAVLAVSDNGVGMDETTRRRIFEPFFSTKGVGEGSGLGLPMVQGIVAQSDGYIDVDSEPGRGTTFKVCLPALAEAHAGAAKSVAIAAQPGNETILVVEDQLEVREYAAAVLQACGYRVIQAANADEALAASERESGRIHLALTDVVMPRVSGWELAQRLEKIRPGIKTVFMSGYTDDVVVRRGFQAESAHFIQKPFSQEELTGKVREVLSPRAPGACDA